MKIFLVFFLTVLTVIQAVSFHDVVLEDWKAFKAHHKKTYKNDIEEGFRLKIFMENKHKITQHNTKYELGKVPFKQEINKFADMLHHEFVSTFNGFNKSSSSQLHSSKILEGVEFVMPANVELPKSVDWRELGAVTPVKDQGHCGSCWSFSTTGALEGQYFRKTNQLVSLSEQNLIDCSSKYGNNGCNGGLMDNAFKYIKDNRGIDTEISYPYEGKNDVCRYNPNNFGAEDVGFVDIEEGNEKKLKAAVATMGPVSVAIDASHPTFQFYSEGVYFEPECSSVNLDHGVLIVGYGTNEHGKDYWLVKNSWGKSWGLDGYIKMARNKKNHCGIASSASYPLV